MDRRIFSLGIVSDKGIVKETNQDSILIKIGEGKQGEFGLFAVADGMGGHAEGGLASAMAIHCLQEWWSSDLQEILEGNSQDSEQSIGASLNNTLHKANRIIMDYSSCLGQKMGTTTSMLFIYGDRFWIKHVGDSRIYKVNKGIEQLTEDHSWVSGLIMDGSITRAAAARHPKRNILTRCLGMKQELELFEAEGEVHSEDIFILCSDGFYVKLEEPEIADMLDSFRGHKQELQSLVDRLFLLVKSRGEKDNISAIFVSGDAAKNIGFIKKLLYSFTGHQ